MTHHFPSFSSVWNFLLLIAALIYFLRKPIREALFGRQEGISKSVEESEKLRQEVEAMVREYDAKLKGLDREVFRLMEEAKEAGERERERILERARQTAERIVEDAKALAERETDRVKRKLQQEIVEKAIRQATELLAGKITEKEHRRFSDELVNRLEGGTGSSR